MSSGGEAPPEPTPVEPAEPVAEAVAPQAGPVAPAARGPPRPWLAHTPGGGPPPLTAPGRPRILFDRAGPVETHAAPPSNSWRARPVRRGDLMLRPMSDRTPRGSSDRTQRWPEVAREDRSPRHRIPLLQPAAEHATPSDVPAPRRDEWPSLPPREGEATVRRPLLDERPRTHAPTAHAPRATTTADDRWP